MEVTKMEARSITPAGKRLLDRVSDWLWQQAAWQRLEYALAIGFIRLRLNRRPRAMQALYRLSQPLMGLVLLLSESGRASNQILLSWDGDETPTDFDDILNDIAELIERAPAPMGVDDYRISAYRLGRLPNEVSVNESRLHDTLRQRKVVASRRVQGDRYSDWKHGSGKQAARALLEEFDTTPECPVTLIEVICTGRAVAHTLQAFEEGNRGAQS